MNQPTLAEPAAAPSYQVVGPEHAEALSRCIERLRLQKVETSFHPHPLTAQEAHKRAAYQGRDFYYVQVLEGKIIGYGMLRGRDEGYEIPGIGVAVDPGVKGKGYGRSLMKCLRAAARERGANRLHATVNPDNVKMVAYCRSQGCVSQDLENGRLVAGRPLDPSF